MKFLLAFFCLFWVCTAPCQNTIALPAIINYPKAVYNSGTQIHDIKQDKQGILYFANNEGLLSFDGSSWRIYSLPNETKIMSLAVGKDGRIYVGSQHEIGFFAPGMNGRLEYTSLTYLIPRTQLDFAEVWNIIPVGDQLFFRSNRKIFQYDAGRITVYGSIDWNFMGYSNGLLIAHDFKAGLVYFKEGHWIPAAGGPIPGNARITSVVALNGDSTLITTLKNGLFILSKDQIVPFNSPDVKAICSKNVYVSAAIGKDRFALGTNFGGCYVINQKGELIQRLSKQDGIQNNNILSLFLDRDRNLWLGLDNGIDFIAWNNPIRHIFPDNQEHSAGYTSLIYQNALYLGTSNGLYKAPMTPQKDLGYIKTDFQLIPNSKGQVWNLSEVNGQLLMGHNEGAFVIQNDRAVSLDTTSGFWSFQPLETIAPSPVMVSGTYNGVNFYNFENGRFVNRNVHSHFESALFLNIDNGIIWVIHPYHGLYKVSFNNQKPVYSIYNDKGNILSKNRNYLFKVKNRLVITNDKGIFEYDNRKEVFEPSGFFNAIFGHNAVQYMKEDEAGNLWFVQAKKLGVVDFSQQSPRIIYLPELDNKVMAGNHEWIYPYNENNVFVAGEEGFYLINFENYKKLKDNTSVLIRNVRSVGKSDSVYFDGYFAGNSGSQTHVNKMADRIGYESNSLHFEYSCPVYSQQSTVEYSYYLEGFDRDWSAWIKKNEKDYTNLPPGTYTFQVKARRHAQTSSVVSSYRFIILPPWYRTFWAYGLAILLVLVTIYLVSKWQKRKFLQQQQKHLEEQKRILYLHQLEMERREGEIIRLKNEKLVNEIHHKNSELASTAMNLVQKGEMLTKIKDEVIRMKNTAEKGHTQEDYKRIIRMLEENKATKDWDQFAQHFDSVYSDFLAALQEQYPNLTAGESKLCAYLRLNLTSKEISQLMNITVKSVELNRYRLRKKLQLSTEVNLANFLSTFHSEDRSSAER